MDFSHIYSSKVGGNNRLDYLTMKMTVITYICKKGGEEACVLLWLSAFKQKMKSRLAPVHHVQTHLLLFHTSNFEQTSP